MYVALDKFGANLHCVMLHWDDRADESLMEETCGFLSRLSEYKLEVGLSGIKHVEAYRNRLNNMEGLELNIQAKYNFLYDGLENYQPLNGLSPRYWAYGISAGGLKLSSKEYNSHSSVFLVRGIEYHDNMLCEEHCKLLANVMEKNTEIKNLYQLAVAFTEQQDSLYGYLIAPTDVTQLNDTYEFRRNVDFSDLNLSELKKLRGQC